MTPGELRELMAPLDEVIAAARLEHAALKQMVEWYGPAHSLDCPQDDTCYCEHAAFNDAVNRAINRMDAALKGLEAVKQKA